MNLTGNDDDFPTTSFDRTRNLREEDRTRTIEVQPCDTRFERKFSQTIREGSVFLARRTRIPSPLDFPKIMYAKSPQKLPTSTTPQMVLIKFHPRERRRR